MSCTFKEGDILIIETQYGKLLRVAKYSTQHNEFFPFVTGCGFEKENLVGVKGNITDYGLKLSDLDIMSYHSLNQKVKELVDQQN